MAGNDGSKRYHPVTRALHWLIAAGIVFLIWLGWYLVGLSYFDPWFNDALIWHRALGLLVLVLAVFSLLWRLWVKDPPLSPRLRPWERVAARCVHALLALAALLIPLTGYLISSSDGEPVPLWGELAVPALMEVSTGLRDFAIAAHYYLAYGCGVLALLHASAALKHHFVDRDDTLRKML